MSSSLTNLGGGPTMVYTSHPLRLTSPEPVMRSCAARGCTTLTAPGRRASVHAKTRRRSVHAHGCVVPQTPLTCCCPGLRRGSRVRAGTQIGSFGRTRVENVIGVLGCSDSSHRRRVRRATQVARSARMAGPPVTCSRLSTHRPESFRMPPSRRYRTIPLSATCRSIGQRRRHWSEPERRSVQRRSASNSGTTGPASASR